MTLSEFIKSESFNLIADSTVIQLSMQHPDDTKERYAIAFEGNQDDELFKELCERRGQWKIKHIHASSTIFVKKAKPCISIQIAMN